MKCEPLSKRVNRAKARWLKRVMYSPDATSTQKCLAYAIADHLNCVTLDCWPGQLRLTQLLGRKSSKTVQRSAGRLQEMSAIMIRRIGKGDACRYAPVFLPGDEDENVLKKGHSCPELGDTDVHQSFLEIHLRSDSTAAEGRHSEKGRPKAPPFRRAQRGGLEIEVAKMLGPDGMRILGVLGELDDRIIDRLCGAYVECTLGEGELAAARLAAGQVRWK
jgi:hypothetical protein